MTAKMLLHWSPRSPYRAQGDDRGARAAGLPTASRPCAPWSRPRQPNVELMKENPQSRLPTLRLADGTVIYDSPVICEYFDSLHDGEKLFPEKFPERLVALRRHALGDGMLDTMLMWRGEQLRPAAQPVDQAHAGLEAEDQRLGRHAGRRRPTRSRRRASRSATSRSASRSATSISAFPSWPGATGIRGSPRGTRRSRRGRPSRRTSRWTSHDPSPQHRRRAHHRRDRVFRPDARAGFSLSGRSTRPSATRC